MKKYLLLAVICVFRGTIFAQDCPMDMGINLYSIVNWSREMPFADLMKQSMPWVSQNQNFVPDGINAFDSGVMDSILLNSNGYPLALPQKVAGAEGPQSVVTLLVKNNGGIHPDGDYTLTFKGQGEVILVGEDVSSLVSVETNKRVYRVIVRSKGDIGLKIVSSDKNDPVRDIKVMLPGHDESDLFNKAFLDKVKQFKTVRFLNWQHINHSKEVGWDTRANINYYTLNTEKGVPLEYMVALCNRIGANIWVCIPHQADDAYVESMATMLKNDLDPALKVYLEYSNEVWNESFPQYDWVNANAPANLLSPEQRYAYFARKTFSLFTSVFQDDLTRIKRVLSGQQANPNIINRSSQAMKDQFGEDLYDAISCTGSLSFTAEQLHTMNEHTTVKDIGSYMRKNIGDVLTAAMLAHKQKAGTLGKDFVAYESSGLGSVSYASPDKKPLFADSIYAYNKDTIMSNIYKEWLEFLRDSIGLSLCCSFVLADDNEAIYGCYGHLNSIFDTKPYALAYQVISGINCRVVSTDEVEGDPEIKIYPNPVSSHLMIEGAIASYYIYDNRGVLVASSRSASQVAEVDLSYLLPGIYYIRLNNGKSALTRKIVKLE